MAAVKFRSTITLFSVFSFWSRCCCPDVGHASVNAYLTGEEALALSRKSMRAPLLPRPLRPGKEQRAPSCLPSRLEVNPEVIIMLGVYHITGDSRQPEGFHPKTGTMPLDVAAPLISSLRRGPMGEYSKHVFDELVPVRRYIRFSIVRQS